MTTRMTRRYLGALGIALALSFCAKEAKPPAADTATTSADTAAGIQPAAEAGSSPAFHLDHFKFWKVKSIPFEAGIALKGQFDKDGWRARVRSLEYLGNPVDKNAEGIQNEKLHYLGYVIETGPQPKRSVTLRNQLTVSEPNGVVTWTIGPPTLLLNPAAKSHVIITPPPSPPDGSHFACYRVLDPKPLGPPIRLSDQFDKKREKIEQITKLLPVFFCVPVVKTHDGKESPILDEKTHLAIYRIDPQDAFAISVMAVDQFGVKSPSSEHSEMLAVPSLKLAWN